MPMRPLLTLDTHDKVRQLRTLIDDAFLDGHVDPDERRLIREAVEDASDSANRTHRRTQLATALMRDTTDAEYLSDLGMRAGVYGLEAA